MKKYIPYLTLLGIILITIYAFAGVQRMKNDNRMITDRLYGKLNNLNNVNAMLNHYMFVQYSDIDRKVDLSVNVYDSVGKATKIGSVLHGDNDVLVFRYSNLHCDICIEEELQNIANANIGLPIIILTSYQRDKDLTIFRKLNKIDVPIYNLKGAELPCEMEALDVPYYFVLNTASMRISYPFVPIKEIEGRSKYYFELLDKVYNETEGVTYE